MFNLQRSTQFTHNFVLLLQYRGGVAAGVQRAERDISTIVKNEVLANDLKTFRITWADDKVGRCFKMVFVVVSIGTFVCC